MKVPQEALFDQGMQEPNLKGLRVGDTAVLESPEHGKVAARITSKEP